MCKLEIRISQMERFSIDGVSIKELRDYLDIIYYFVGSKDFAYNLSV